MIHFDFPSNNIGYLCTDWQVEQGRGDKTALIWLSSNLDSTIYSFRELNEKSNQFVNVLKELGVHKGDKIMLLLPRIPELFIFFLGTLKAGVNACILFNSIGGETLRNRILDSETNWIVTNKNFLFKIDEIEEELPEKFKILILGDDIQSEKRIGLDVFIQQAEKSFEPSTTNKDQPSHFHFTSGSTGKPKGVQHVHAAVEAIASSFMEVMQPNPDDLYWCTADQGWVTGVSYGIIGPWVNGITQVQFEGNFNAELWMKILEKYHVNLLYSAPTVFRMLMLNDDSFFRQFDISVLKRIYCVGEPLNPVIVEWCRRVLGKDIYDTWFQTETGSIMIANRPGLEVRPGSMGRPLSYIDAAILNDKGKPLPPLEKGLLCIKKPWSSMFVEYMNDLRTYHDKFMGEFYSSGDVAFSDHDGYYWFIGRNDDVINTAGHLVSPFEVESALLEMDEVTDVGVVGVPDDVLYEKIVAFVVKNNKKTDERQTELKMKLHVSNKVSSMAAPKEIIFVDSVPKTKTGKKNSRVLRNRYLNLDLGDLSTLEEY